MTPTPRQLLACAFGFMAVFIANAVYLIVT